ncbi:hypothetical protein [Brachyspira hyodysenteriae]|nr:hypothetical protein [Brachyspira hyodysenteriae]MCZ9889733.1 hypothetical protein [Brachyspira hyodysenteriae]
MLIWSLASCPLLAISFALVTLSAQPFSILVSENSTNSGYSIYLE